MSLELDYIVRICQQFSATMRYSLTYIKPIDTPILNIYSSLNEQKNNLIYLTHCWKNTVASLPPRGLGPNSRPEQSFVNTVVQLRP